MIWLGLGKVANGQQEYVCWGCEHRECGFYVRRAIEGGRKRSLPILGIVIRVCTL